MHITIVSIKVPVIDINPCLTGELVFAAAAAIGALPKPASFEKTPLPIPLWIAIDIVIPTALPRAALGLNALTTINFTAAGTVSILNINTINAPTI